MIKTTEENNSEINFKNIWDESHPDKIKIEKLFGKTKDLESSINNIIKNFESNNKCICLLSIKDGVIHIGSSIELKIRRND